MDVRQFNKAQQVRSGWSYELMAISCRTGRGFPGTAGLAKRFTNRAFRRAAAYYVEEGLEDYWLEEQEHYDALYHEELTRDFMAAEAYEARVEEAKQPDLDFLMTVFNGRHEYIWDGNGPGVVYYCPEGLGRRCCDALRNQGCVPVLADRDEALRLAVEGIARGWDEDPWHLSKAPEWWYTEDACEA